MSPTISAVPVLPAIRPGWFRRLRPVPVSTTSRMYCPIRPAASGGRKTSALSSLARRLALQPSGVTKDSASGEERGHPRHLERCREDITLAIARLRKIAAEACW